MDLVKNNVEKRVRACWTVVFMCIFFNNCKGRKIFEGFI